MFNKLFAICLLVDNFEKSLKFYRDKLGLEVDSQEGKFANFKVGKTSLAIFEKKRGRRYASHTVYEIRWRSRNWFPS